MWESIKNKIEAEFSFQLNRNQWRDLKRLIYEIYLREEASPKSILEELKKNSSIKKLGGRNKFLGIKSYLIRRRFPQTTQHSFVDTKTVYLAEVKNPLKINYRPQGEFTPEKIFVEKEARNSYLLNRFKEKFNSVEVEELNYYSEYIKRHKFKLGDLKRPLVFIVKERWDFLKPCPCTKQALGCNYWIFNLGFGCPFDCSYCYLQVYSNFPGIILPANLNDFFNKFEDFYKKLKKPIRIGTGEFCDSLALDEITDYSSQLIDFFKNKNLYFELKTKSKNIKNLLKTAPSPNIVISFSLNPSSIIEKEEINTSSLEERLYSAAKLKEKGYSLGFHFDPIIYFEGWEELYKELIHKLYQHISPSFKWISLGTLRGPRRLKDIVEQRFPESKIFYGELFLDKDKKLRYPEFLRVEIYKKISGWIRKYDEKTPLYLCMESKEIWQKINKKMKTPQDIEEYLVGTYL